jgi:hypothetical protein
MYGPCIDSKEGVLAMRFLGFSCLHKLFSRERELNTSKFDSEDTDGNYRIQLAKNEK